MSLDIKKINTKIVLIFSVLGFFLSFISGLFAGTKFLGLIFSSIISGTVIGIIIVISNILIMTYIPELLEEEEEEEYDADSQVNIVMPEEGYTVQKNENYDGSEINSDVAASGTTSEGSSGEGFKEISMDNLSSLGASTDSVNQVSEDQNSEYNGGVAPPASIKGDTSFDKHSTEDMAKAVKTVLKKD